MKDTDIIKIFLDAHEWQTFECKRAAIRPADLLETVVAFANRMAVLSLSGLKIPLKPREKSDC